MSESFKLQAKSKRTNLLQQAIDHVGFDVRKALFWSMVILAVTAFGIGITYWLGQKQGNSLTPAISEAPKSAIFPKSAANKSGPSVTAPYFTEAMNKEVAKFRVEREKGALDRRYMEKATSELTAEQSKNVAPRDMAQIAADRKELNRMAVETKIADTATAREYALETVQEYSVRQLLDAPPAESETSTALDPPIPQEPTFIDKIWQDIRDALKDIADFFP